MRGKAVPVAMTLCIAVAFVVVVAAPTSTNPKWIPTIQKTTLDNGLEILTSDISDNGILTVGILVKAGSACDPEGKAGLANLVAHSLLMRSPKLSATKFAARINTVCAAQQITVTRDATLFLFQIPTAETETLLELVAPAITSAKFEKEAFEMVRNRTVAMLRDQGSQVREVLSRNIYDLVFTGHPYATAVVGTEASLNNISQADVNSFYRNYYGANNAVLALVGDLEGIDATAIVKKHMGTWREASSAPVNVTTPTTTKTTPIRLVNRSGTSIAHVCMARPIPGPTSEDFVAALALAEVLGGGPYARLHRAAMEKIKGCYGIGAMVEPGRVSLLRIGAVCHDEEAQTVINTFSDVMDEVIANGIKEEELNLAKTRLERRIMASFADPMTLTQTILTGLVAGLDPTRPSVILDRIRGLTTQKLNTLASNTLKPDQFALIVVGNRATLAENLRRLNDVEVVEFAGEIPVPAMRTILKKTAK